MFVTRETQLFLISKRFFHKWNYVAKSNSLVLVLFLHSHDASNPLAFIFFNYREFIKSYPNLTTKGNRSQRIILFFSPFYFYNKINM